MKHPEPRPELVEGGVGLRRLAAFAVPLGTRSTLFRATRDAGLMKRA
jgi:hypothetical protein